MALREDNPIYRRCSEKTRFSPAAGICPLLLHVPFPAAVITPQTAPESTLLRPDSGKKAERSKWNLINRSVSFFLWLCALRAPCGRSLSPFSCGNRARPFSDAFWADMFLPFAFPPFKKIILMYYNALTPPMSTKIFVSDRVFFPIQGDSGASGFQPVVENTVDNHKI